MEAGDGYSSGEDESARGLQGWIEQPEAQPTVMALELCDAQLTALDLQVKSVQDAGAAFIGWCLRQEECALLSCNLGMNSIREEGAAALAAAVAKAEAAGQAALQTAVAQAEADGPLRDDWERIDVLQYNAGTPGIESRERWERSLRRQRLAAPMRVREVPRRRSQLWRRRERKARLRWPRR